MRVPPDGPVSFRDTLPADSLDLEHTQALLTAAWDVRGIEMATLKVDRKGTLVREREPDRSSQLRTLPSLLSPGPRGAAPQFQLGEMLGEGGMGIVWRAAQPALDRVVAVKSLRQEVDPKSGTPQLLREARVTGVLEHPNVVPVYALGRDDADRPLLVMKRIEGKTWQSILSDADPATRRRDDYLRDQLAILKQVALAAHYAHSKGVIHRDLKPENVMVGGFGEVYVVDWGIAVSVREGGVRDLPLVKDVAAIEGTPAYMAPEMAAADGDSIDERSDVYLLGGVLHEILTGLPPHDGQSILAVLTNAFASRPPQFDEHVPRGLADICRKAMARFPHDRYGSALELADAIDEFMVRRAALQLTEVAQARLARLEQLVAAGATDDRAAEILYATFSECRFAFDHALESWSDNEVAAAGRERALLLMIDYELSRDAPAAAKALLGSLRTPSAELIERVEEALTKKRAAEARLAKLERDADLTFGIAVRRFVIVIVSLVYGLAWIACGVLTRYGIYEARHLTIATINGTVTAALLLAMVARRETLLGNASNRRLSATAVGAFFTYTLFWVLAHRLRLELPSTTAIHALIGTTTWGVGAINLDRRWTPIAFSMALTVVAVLLWPVYHFELLGSLALAGSAVAAARHLRD